MAARNMGHSPRALGAVMLFVLSSMAHTAFAEKAACTHAQLEIRQIALDSPGMSQSNAFFAILNIGKRACRLTAELARISEKPNRDSFSDKAPIDYILLPLRNQRFAGAKNLVGFNVSNNGASGSDRHIHSLVFELAGGKTFSAAYQGYDTSPFSPWAKIIRFSAWKVFDSDQCMLARSQPLSFPENPEVDTRTLMACG